MSYREHLPPLPATFERELAIDYHGAILELLGRPGWTRSEKRSLQRLERRWKKRALGQDLRWALVGDKAGRLPRDQEAAVSPKKHPAWAADVPFDTDPDDGPLQGGGIA